MNGVGAASKETLLALAAVVEAAAAAAAAVAAVAAVVKAGISVVIFKVSALGIGNS
jgi:hypothetical protein